MITFKQYINETVVDHPMLSTEIGDYNEGWIYNNGKPTWIGFTTFTIIDDFMIYGGWGHNQYLLPGDFIAMYEQGKLNERNPDTDYTNNVGILNRDINNLDQNTLNRIGEYDEGDFEWSEIVWGRYIFKLKILSSFNLQSQVMVPSNFDLIKELIKVHGHSFKDALYSFGDMGDNIVVPYNELNSNTNSKSEEQRISGIEDHLAAAKGNSRKFHPGYFKNFNKKHIPLDIKQLSQTSESVQ